MANKKGGTGRENQEGSARKTTFPSPALPGPPGGWIRLTEVTEIIRQAKTPARRPKFVLRASQTDWLGQNGRSSWNYADSDEHAFTLNVSRRHGVEYVKSEDWEKIRHDYIATRPPANGRNAGHGFAPLAPNYVNLMMDNTVLSDLSAQRTGGRFWLDLLTLCQQFPTIRLVIPSTVADVEFCGKIPQITGSAIKFTEFDHKTARRNNTLNGAVPFMKDATRIITDDSGNPIREITGKNPKMIILHSPAQDMHYRMLEETKRELLDNDVPVYSVHQHPDIVKLKQNKGDEVIEDFCRSADRPVIVLTNDIDLTNALLSLHTKDGYAVGAARLSGFLAALEKTYGKELGAALSAYFHAEEPDATAHSILEAIQSNRDRNIGDSTETHIFPGVDKEGKIGRRLDDVLMEGARMLHQWEKEQKSQSRDQDKGKDTEWTVRSSRESPPDQMHRS